MWANEKGMVVASRIKAAFLFILEIFQYSIRPVVIYSPPTPDRFFK
jgi:hypothetical protein